MIQPSDPDSLRYQAEVYHSDSGDLTADLLHWKSRRAAVQACEEHALETLVFTERWSGC